MTELEAIDELRNRLAELEKKLDDREADLIEAKREEREGIFREIDKCSSLERLPYRDGGEGLRTIPESSYQALKEKE